MVGQHDKPYIFISHAWHQEATYTALREMLDYITEKRWTDLSIPRGRGLDLLSSGERALFQELELQERMIATVEGMRADLQKQLDELETKAKTKYELLEKQREQVEARLAIQKKAKAERIFDVENLDRDERIDQRIELCTARIDDYIKRGAGQTQLDEEQNYLENLRAQLRTRDLEVIRQRRRQLERELQNCDLEIRSARRKRQEIDMEKAALRTECGAVAERVRLLNSELESRRVRMANLNAESSPHLYNIISGLKSIIIHNKVNPELIRSHPTLSLAIFERISRSDIVFVIAGMYDQYRSWMEFELGVAAGRHKPILAVLPPGQCNRPVEMRYFAKQTVALDCGEIHRAMDAAFERVRADRGSL